MPELPEVETIRIQLEKFIVGHKVEDIKINNERSFLGNKQNIIGAKIKSVRRFGKVLSVDFDNDYSAVIHVKMTGQLIYTGPYLESPPKQSKKIVGGVPGRHTHVVFELDKNGVLYFNDLRKFGWIKVVPTNEVQKIGLINKMGPEPLNDLTLDKFKEIIRSTKRSIKVLLMDQSKIGGVGNIYANDALYLAKIHPERQANSLNENEIKDLFERIEEVLKKGISTKGSSENSYVTPDGSEGTYQNHTVVYGKDGEKCERCGSIIQKSKVGGRGTYFCPKCQNISI